MLVPLEPPPDGPIEVAIAGDLRVTVPSALDQITPYVLLEQEAWFEKEAAFLPRSASPGDEAIDVGANFGLYSLALARAVGPAGRVIAYEPAAATRALLALSRDRNAVPWLDIRAAALSDTLRDGHLAHAGSSELHSLGAIGEPVAITSLDAEDEAGRWRSPALVKLDAEGEEARIIAGGARFFARHDPLVMFEVKAGEAVDDTLRSAFPALGYAVFRLLPAGLLVPDDPAAPLDAYELNLFAAKPARAAALAARGLLVETFDFPVVEPADPTRALAPLLAMPFAARLRPWAMPLEPGWLAVLDGAARWADAKLPWAGRVAALRDALLAASAACEARPSPARLATLARLAWDWGARGASRDAAEQLVQLTRPGLVFRLEEPFWPPHARFDSLDCGAAPGPWFATAAAEHLERVARHSSAFGGGTATLDWLCRQPWASTEMLRRQALLAMRRGLSLPVDERLRHAAPDHRNAALWQRMGGQGGLRG